VFEHALDQLVAVRVGQFADAGDDRHVETARQRNENIIHRRLLGPHFDGVRLYDLRRQHAQGR
jgi:hypothetical protein